MNTTSDSEHAVENGSGLSKAEHALITAQGKMLAVLAASLEQSCAFDVRQFSERLALFSTVVGEEDRLEGLVMACWADIVRESSACRDNG